MLHKLEDFCIFLQILLSHCRFDDGDIDCDDCNGSGVVEGKLCKTCKGKGLVKCKHPDIEICSDCSQGLKTLGAKTIEDIKRMIK